MTIFRLSSCSLTCLLLWFALMASCHAAATGPAMAPAPAPAGPAQFLYLWHGWLMYVGFGLLMPIGVMIARYMQGLTGHWYLAHMIVQTIAVACIIVAWVIAYQNFDALYDSLHAKLGIWILALVCFQPVWAVLRPHKGTMGRTFWYFVHWAAGTTLVLLAWSNVYSGCLLYAEDQGVSTTTVQNLFTINIAILGFLYLFFNTWARLKAQEAERARVGPYERFPSFTWIFVLLGLHKKSRQGDYNKDSDAENGTVDSNRG
eukprot:TRINITY_DN36593_c0_g1_i1.p1 TRINITY_DN36593_c0_g1~~TRINITY_DN36593_c0_g1_i1.p1  ORF type:complete len:260 (+),score=12.34 TRINITY_DN36593_c0_g1_i1:393-1172(+)